MAYAANTVVPVIQSITELDRLVSKYGASGFAFGRDDSSPVTRVMFKLNDRALQFEVTKPNLDDYRLTRQYQKRTIEQQRKLADTEERRRWRALILVVKALLVGVEDGVITMDDAFLAYMVIPGDGRTVGAWAAQQLADAYTKGTPLQLLPGAARAIES